MIMKLSCSNKPNQTMINMQSCISDQTLLERFSIDSSDDSTTTTSKSMSSLQRVSDFINNSDRPKSKRASGLHLIDRFHDDCQKVRSPKSSSTMQSTSTTTHRSHLSSNVVFLLLLTFLSTAILSVSSSSVNDCRGVRYAYSAKGLDLKDVPRQPRQGSQLQICPRGLTCCTEEMERKLWSISKDQYTKGVKSQAASLMKMFNNRAKKFDEYFMDLLVKSKLKFHKLFQKTYGIIYERNSDVFIDFFKDLESYYDDGKVNLEDALRGFFTHLYQRMFTVFNAQHNFDNTYLSCVSQTMKKLQPFGDVPKQLTEQLRRSFVATRTFAQALLEGKQILNKILKVAPKDECVVGLTKMFGCSACQGIPAIRTCKDFCVNVMKGCLAYHSELGESWDKFVEHLQILSDRLLGPFDIEAVVVPIGLKISDAIMNFQNSGYEVTAKVFQDCGTPRLQKRQSNYGNNAQDQKSPPSRIKNSYSTSVGSPASSASAAAATSTEIEDTRLKSLIREIRESVGNAKRFWIKLPYSMCEEEAKGSTAEAGSCWTGQDAGKYANPVVGDGLNNQEHNPEVSVDIGRPDVYINEQIFALKLITKKIESAHKGQNVDWPASISVYMADKAVSSGDGCDPYSDDEDCYDAGINTNSKNPNTSDDEDDEEGSGSGDSSNDFVPSKSSGGKSKNSGGKHHNTEDSDDEEEENWPPWVTAKPDGDKDIVVDDPGTTKKAEQSPTVKSGSSPSLHLSRALVYYLVPVLTCLLGSFASW